MSDPLPPEREPDLIDSDDDQKPTVGSADPGTRVLAGLIRFGRWLVRRRTPLVLIPTTAALIVAGSMGAQLLLEEIPEPAVTAPPVICWDQEEAPSAKDCSTPSGTPGLRWVFPSFAPKKDECRNLKDRSSPRPTEWECVTTLKNGTVVRVSYIELADAKGGRVFYDKQFAGAEREEIRDREGGPFRYVWRQRTDAGFELASVLTDFPFAVTVFSENAAFRDKIFESRVKFRQPKGILVRKYPVEPTEAPQPPVDELPEESTD